VYSFKTRYDCIVRYKHIAHMVGLMLSRVTQASLKLLVFISALYGQCVFKCVEVFEKSLSQIVYGVPVCELRKSISIWQNMDKSLAACFWHTV